MNKRVITAFVMMPFGSKEEYRDKNEESDFVYNKIIVPAISKALGDDYEVSIIREVDRNIPGSITREIIRNIAKADIVVVDLTGQNPNVFFELGIRFALRNKVTVLIAQNGTVIPFDVRDYRAVMYKIVNPEFTIAQISNAIIEGLKNKRVSDSLVFDSFDEISVVIPGYCESHSHATSTDRNLMLWPEFWNRIEVIYSLLEGPATNGQFTPDAIMGISNGGLIVADLIGRMIFHGKPILSLWADRFSKPPGDSSEGYWYFDNDYNNAIIEVIKTKVKGRNAVILVLDDHLGTGTTAHQMKSYLNMRFEGKVSILYIPMFSKRPEYIKVVEDLLPPSFDEGKTFKSLDTSHFLESMSTNASHFPYRKEISGA